MPIHPVLDSVHFYSVPRALALRYNLFIPVEFGGLQLVKPAEIFLPHVALNVPSPTEPDSEGPTIRSWSLLRSALVYTFYSSRIPVKATPHTLPTQPSTLAIENAIYRTGPAASTSPINTIHFRTDEQRPHPIGSKPGSYPFGILGSRRSGTYISLFVQS